MLFYISGGGSKTSHNRLYLKVKSYCKKSENVLRIGVRNFTRSSLLRFSVENFVQQCNELGLKGPTKMTTLELRVWIYSKILNIYLFDNPKWRNEMIAYEREREKWGTCAKRFLWSNFVYSPILIWGVSLDVSVGEISRVTESMSYILQETTETKKSWNRILKDERAELKLISGIKEVCDEKVSFLGK